MIQGRLWDVARVLSALLSEEAARMVGIRGHLAGADSLTREQARAQSIRRAMESLGPFYVKIGQMLSTRPDLVSPTMIAEFQNLHDRVSIVPFTEFEPVLDEQLGSDWLSYFSEVQTDRPIGAASLAQVYRVSLRDGTPAVVKVQRPDIAERMRSDIALLRRAARMLAKRARAFNEVVDIEATLETLFQAMEPEIDFTIEARNMEQVRPLVARYRNLTMPEVVFVTPKVLVQGLASGRSLGDTDCSTFDESQRLAIGEDLLRLMYRGFFVDRIFHADPHAGNVFVEPGMPATLIDWGMIGRLDRRMSLAMIMVLINIAQNDGAGVAKAWIEMGRATSTANVPAFINDLSSFIPTIAGASLEDLNLGVALTSILKFSGRRGIQTSPAVALLGKAFANAEGSIRQIAPELKLLDIFQSEFQDIVFDLVAESASETQAARIAMEMMIGSLAAPEQIRSLARDLSNRDLTLNVRQSLGGIEQHRSDRRWQWVKRTALIVMAAFIWRDRRDHRIQ
jgi:ubiquinone biosynthesis protein